MREQTHRQYSHGPRDLACRSDANLAVDIEPRREGHGADIEILTADIDRVVDINALAGRSSAFSIWVISLSIPQLATSSA